MSEYLSGESPEQKMAVLNQLNLLYEHMRPTSAFVVGSLARAAMYSHFGYTAPALPIRGGRLLKNSWLDIDVLSVQNDDDMDIEVPGPLKIEDSLDDIVDIYDERWPQFWLLDPDSVDSVPVDAHIFERRTRYLDDVPVFTLSVGTHLELERFVTVWANDGDTSQSITPNYAPSLQRFARFAASMRITHPEEFYPDELYQPLRRAAGL